jgi:hypothetical protein
VRRLNELGIAHRYEEFPRQPQRCRLPDGREPAFSRAGAVRLTCMVMKQFPSYPGGARAPWVRLAVSP